MFIDFTATKWMELLEDFWLGGRKLQCARGLNCKLIEVMRTSFFIFGTRKNLNSLPSFTEKLLNVINSCMTMEPWTIRPKVIVKKLREIVSCNQLWTIIKWLRGNFIETFPISGFYSGISSLNELRSISSPIFENARWVLLQKFRSFLAIFWRQNLDLF